MASKYIQETLNLIQDIERSKKESIDLLKYKDRFFIIENEIKKIPQFEINFDKLIQDKLKNIKESSQDKNNRIFIAYLNMIDLLSKAKDSFMSAGLIMLMIPVICELIRENENDNT